MDEKRGTRRGVIRFDWFSSRMYCFINTIEASQHTFPPAQHVLRHLPARRLDRLDLETLRNERPRRLRPLRARGLVVRRRCLQALCPQASGSRAAYGT